MIATLALYLGVSHAPPTHSIQLGSILVDSLVGIGAALSFVTFGLPGYTLVFNAIAIFNVKSQMGYLSTLYDTRSLTSNQIVLPAQGTGFFTSLPSNISICDWSNPGCASPGNFSSANGTSPNYAILDNFPHADFGSSSTILLGSLDTYNSDPDKPDSGTSCASSCAKLVYSSVTQKFYGQ